MTVTFMTDDEWAQLKNYTKFATDSGNGYVDTNETPTAAGLDLIRRRAYAAITGFIPGKTPQSGNEDYLLDLEFRTVELMLDDEQGRTEQEGRNIYIPRDFIFARDRSKLGSIGTTFTRGTGN